MINHVKGDLFAAIKNRKNVLIPHIVNNVPAWGAGFVLAINKNLGPEPKDSYFEFFHKWKQLGYKHDGEVDFAYVTTFPMSFSDNVIVANMFAQDGISSSSTGDRSRVNNKPIKYSWLIEAMNEVRSQSIHYDLSIHAPKFGSGLAGGNWDLIEELIEELWGDLDVTIYSL